MSTSDEKKAPPSMTRLQKGYCIEFRVTFEKYRNTAEKIQLRNTVAGMLGWKNSEDGPGIGIPHRLPFTVESLP